MANYGKYYIAVRLLLLKQYLEANAGRTRIVKRRELDFKKWNVLAFHKEPNQGIPISGMGFHCHFV